MVRFDKVITDNGIMTYKPLSIMNHPTLLNGLVSAYSLDGDAIDVHGTNDGTVSGATFVESGLWGDCASFDGTDDYIEIDDDDSLDITNDITFSFWVYPKSKGTAWYQKALVMKSDDYGDNISYGIRFGDGKLTFQSSPDGLKTNRVLSTLTTDYFTLNEFHYVTVVFDNSENEVKFYINGSLKETIAHSTTGLYSSSTPLTFATLYDNGSIHSSSDTYFDGLIKQVLIYNRALTAKEIKDLYNNGDGLRYR